MDQIETERLLLRPHRDTDAPRLVKEYPAGNALLNGVGKISTDELRALQEKRFKRVVERGWEVPFYDRRWRAVVNRRLHQQSRHAPDTRRRR